MTRTQWWFRYLRLPLQLFGLGYLLFALLAPVIAQPMLYYPQYASRARPEGMKLIAGDAGTRIATLYLANPAARYTIWFFHGNAESLADVEPFLRQLHDAGFAVFAFDYPGYGLSEGHPSEKTLYASARQARGYLHRDLGVASARTIIFGRSLGGGPATQMAIEEHVAGLVLQSAFMSAFRVVTHWRLLPFDPYQNLGKIRHVTSPVLVMHGEVDGVVPFYHGQALFAAAHEPKRALWIPGANHNDFVAVAGNRFWSALRDFADLCARSAGDKP